MLSSKGFPDIEKLLPHRRPMLLLTRIEAIDDRGIVCSAAIDQTLFLARAGTAPPVLGLEMGAQAAGAHRAVAARQDEARPSLPQRGFLVGIRRARFRVDSLPTSVPLHVEALHHGTAGPLAIYDISVTRPDGGEALVEGRVSIWTEQTPPSG